MGLKKVLSLLIGWGVSSAGGYAQAGSKLGVTVDCYHTFNVFRGSTQDCARLQSLKLSLVEDLSSEVKAYVGFDPVGSPDPIRGNSAMRDGRPEGSASALGIVDKLGITWSPRSNLALSVQTFEGVFPTKTISGLATGDLLRSSGWKQLAFVIGYDIALPFPMQVQFVGGNGEGESLANLDPQQYFGFLWDAKVIPGLSASLGISLDGNDFGSEEAAYINKNYTANCGVTVADNGKRLGHSTQRLGAQLTFGEALHGMQGLTFAIGGHRYQARNLSKSARSQPLASDLLAATGCRLDPGQIFAEPAVDAGENTMQRSVASGSLHYQISDRYFVGLDYSARTVTSGDVGMFSSCQAFSGTLCTQPGGTAGKKLGETLWAVGGGMTLSQGLQLSVEYAKRSYDQKYSQFYYSGPRDTAIPESEQMGMRLSYGVK